MFGAVLLLALAATRDPATLSFHRDVIPVLTKSGCNAGRCHGSFQGRGGLRLSLLGFDPDADYDALLKQHRGRRISPAAPEQSLLLRKATAMVPHGGGRRFDLDSPAYRILRDYIAGGVSSANGSAVITRIQVEPARMIVQTEQSQPLRVQAFWNDGVERDVTEWALYDTSNESLAEVSTSGVLTARNPGKAAVVVRYLGQVATVEVVIPFATAATPLEHPRRNFIDELVAADWQVMQVRSAGMASDAEFLRRVSLDLTGTLPTADEARQFLAATDVGKRERLIDELLERPAYVDYWALKWSDLLRAHRRYLGDRGLESFTGWIRRAVRENRPVDQLTRELLTGQGNLFTTGPAAFYFVDEQPADLAETTAQVFLGVRLQCARCHHHPFEVWSQEDYRGLAAYFTHLETKNLDPSGRFGGARILRVSDRPANSRRLPGDPQPRILGAPASPAPTAGTASSTTDLRLELASWVAARDNPYFARNFVNRVWKHLFGRGLVEPVDDLRASNPASMPAVFDAIARDFCDHQFDMKHLLRTICRSAVYQQASESSRLLDQDGALFTHYIPRRVSAEVLLDAISQVTGSPESFPGLPNGTRAIALPDPTVESTFLMTFGRPDRSNACDCARRSQPDLSQTLTLINNSQLQNKIANDSGRLAKAVAANKSDDEIMDELYLATFSRLPTADERQAVRDLISGVKSRREAWEDVLWTLLNTAEFSFNH